MMAKLNITDYHTIRCASLNLSDIFMIFISRPICEH